MDPCLKDREIDDMKIRQDTFERRLELVENRNTGLLESIAILNTKFDNFEKTLETMQHTLEKLTEEPKKKLDMITSEIIKLAIAASSGGILIYLMNSRVM